MNVFKVKEPLVISFNQGEFKHQRAIAEIAPIRGGLLFFDTFWWDSSGHAIHEIRGKITGDGPWSVKSEDEGIKNVRIDYLTQDRFPLLFSEYQTWLQRKNDIDPERYERGVKHNVEEHIRMLSYKPEKED